MNSSFSTHDLTYSFQKMVQRISMEEEKETTHTHTHILLFRIISSSSSLSGYLTHVPFFCPGLCRLPLVSRLSFHPRVPFSVVSPSMSRRLSPPPPCPVLCIILRTACLCNLYAYVSVFLCLHNKRVMLCPEFMTYLLMLWFIMSSVSVCEKCCLCL